MIIGHFDDAIWAPGGIATYIRRIAAQQQDAGHRVHYFSKFATEEMLRQPDAPILVQDDADLFSQAQQRGVNILHLHRGIRSIPPRDLAVVRTVHGHQPYCPSGSKYLESRQQPCDRTHSLGGCLWGHLIDHCGSIRPLNLLRNFQSTQDELRTLSQIPTITVSQFLKDQMIAVGYAADLIQVLYLFAPESSEQSAPPQTNPPRFVFLGRLVPNKGLDWLLRALQRVTVPIHLDIAGEGPQETYLRTLVQQLNLGDRVTFHGWLSAQQTKALLQAARALIFPSLWHEPGGTVAFEAMTQARALIMSRVGGMPEVVKDEINGLLVTPNDVEQLSHSIERLAVDWSLAAQMGAAGRSIAAQHFDAKNHCAQLMAIYQDVIESKVPQAIARHPPDQCPPIRRAAAPLA